MDQPREQLLAGAALAEDEHGRRELRDLLHQLDDVARAAARTDDELAIVLLGDLFAQPHDVAVEILALAGVGDQRAHALEVEVLRDVVIGAVPHRLDRGVELLRARDDDHLDVRIVLRGDLQDLEAADAGQVDVEQHQVDVLLLHHLQRGLARGGAQHAVVAPQASRSASRASPRRRRR